MSLRSRRSRTLSAFRLKGGQQEETPRPEQRLKLTQIDISELRTAGKSPSEHDAEMLARVDRLVRERREYAERIEVRHPK